MDILDKLFSDVETEKKTQSNGELTDKERCRNSLIEFEKTYLSGSGDTLDNFCSFHYDICHRLESIVLTKKQTTESCYECARGHGKSFHVSFAFPLWCIAYKHTQNMLLVTNEASLGRQFIVDIRQFIEDNEKFNRDFGNLVGNTIWTSEKLVCSNGICISSKSTGSSTRGTKIGNWRPTTILCDDILSLENSGTSDARRKTFLWYTQVLAKCGHKYCNTFCIGTPISGGDLIDMMFNSEQFSDYFTKKYPAVLRYSDSDLWDTWTNMRNDLSNPNRSKDADSFYFAHREEMLEGTEVLWDRYDDTYLVLMKERQKLGTEAWASEMMCEIIDESTREFPEEWLENDIYEPGELPEMTDVYIGVDAAATANRTSDDAAIAVVGLGVDHYFYVLEMFSKKINVDGLSDQMLRYAIQYKDKIRSIRIEDVIFQILVKDIMEKKALESGLYLPFEGVKVNGLGKKQVKLRSLCVPVRNGYIKFRKDQRKLLEEFRRFPKGKSDNCLDSLWIATYGVLGGVNNSFSFGSINLQETQKNSNAPMSIKSFINRKRW